MDKQIQKNEKNFEYDTMLYKDIEMDLKKEKSPGRVKNPIIKKPKGKSKKAQRQNNKTPLYLTIIFNKFK